MHPRRKPYQADLPRFSTEAELCTHFISVLPQDWKAYPETAGWDMLLVHDDGIQVGVEAKLKLNTKVLTQCLTDDNAWRKGVGPDYRAVLIPARLKWREDLDEVFIYLGITIIQCYHPQNMDKGFRPQLPSLDKPHAVKENWHEWCPTKRYALPEYVPDVKAGSQAPVRLTSWKIKALKLIARLRLHGAVTRQDFIDLQLDHRRWLIPGHQWLQPINGAGFKTAKGFKAGPHLPGFEEQHPEVFSQIMKDQKPKRVRLK